MRLRVLFISICLTFVHPLLLYWNLEVIYIQTNTFTTIQYAAPGKFASEFQYEAEITS